MKNSYYYLIASLPALQFGMNPPFSYSDFLEACGHELDQAAMDMLAGLSIKPSSDIDDKLHLLKEWKRFNRGLGDELARVRAVKRLKDPNNYLRGESGPDPFIAPLAHWAANQDSPLEAELYLDKARWEKIEEIVTGHYFDIEHLVSYALQLQILERWRNINAAPGSAALEKLAGKI